MREAKRRSFAVNQICLFIRQLVRGEWVKRCLIKVGSVPVTSLVVILVSLTLDSLAWADNVIGFMEGSAPAFQLRIRGLEGLMRVEANPETLAILENVGSGNRIVGTGQVFPIEHRVRLDSVQTVGLRALLGTWQSDRLEIFEFQDFSRLIRYLPIDSKHTALGDNLSETFDYALTPDRSGSYSIFITDNINRMMVGTLSFQTDLISITVYDPRTGQASEKISLSPLFLK